MDNEKIKQMLEEMEGSGANIIVDEIESDMIPVPVERYTDLIKKEVELDLIYSWAVKEGINYAFDKFVTKLANMRFGKEVKEDA